MSKKVIASSDFSFTVVPNKPDNSCSDKKFVIRTSKKIYLRNNKLREIVYALIRNHNGAESCLTRHLLTKLNMYLHFELGSFESVDENTFRSVLNELKNEGLIGHFWSNEDTWVPNSLSSHPCQGRENKKLAQANK